jgi:hypothetical protein
MERRTKLRLSEKTVEVPLSTLPNPTRDVVGVVAIAHNLTHRSVRLIRRGYVSGPPRMGGLNEIIPNVKSLTIHGSSSPSDVELHHEYSADDFVRLSTSPLVCTITRLETMMPANTISCSAEKR